MQAWTTTGPGSLAIVEVDEPEPEPGKAVVAVEAFSPYRGELFLLERAQSGFRPGKDIAGTVVSRLLQAEGRVSAHAWSRIWTIPAGQSGPQSTWTS